MKLPLLLLLLMFALPARAELQNPPSTPTFDWKLRLAKGQKWTQTASVFSESDSESTRFIASLDLEFQNEVLFANSNEYVIRVTLSRCKMESRVNFGGHEPHEPDRSKFTRAFMGIPFKIKQTVRGKIVAVSGLEALIQSGRKSIEKLASSKTERKELEYFLHSADDLKDILTKYQELALPTVPLAAENSYTHLFEAYPSFQSIETVKVKSRLHSFDEQLAHFDEHGELSTYTDHSEFRPVGEGEVKACEAFQGLLSGQTTVDVATGLPQSELDFQATIKTTVINTDGSRSSYVTKKQVQVTLTTKLGS
ncbi:hypothetical protein IAD21_04946 [Abditibacteriota bacterium]|nr:hypothetical protein IAD21_04946 [Abditibacteriota bacterium]